MNPLNHYSFESVPTIFDEEALTVLELCARLAAKVNELVKGHNEQNELITSFYNTELTKQVDEWLKAHPEATTTVQDGALTLAKFITGELGYVTPQLFGAKGDGATNDTEAIKMAIACLNDKCQKLYFPAGTYMVDENILIPSNTYVYGDGPCSTIHRISNNKENYSTFLCYLVENVTFANLMVKGERDTHTGTTGEWGMCINILGSKNITVTDCTLRDGWGDGIYVGASDNSVSSVPSRNVTIKNCVVTNNRRNGVSVTSCEGFRLLNSRITDTHGTNPQCGIDFEPNYYHEVIKDCVIDNCYFNGNTHGNVVVYNSQDVEVTVQNCQLYGEIGAEYASHDIDAQRGGFIKFLNCVFDNRNRCFSIWHSRFSSPLYLYNCTLSSEKIAVEIGGANKSYDYPMGNVHLFGCHVEKTGDVWFRFVNSNTAWALAKVTLNVTIGDDVAKKCIYSNVDGPEISTNIISGPATFSATPIGYDKYNAYHELNVNTADHDVTVQLNGNAPLKVPFTIRKIATPNKVIVTAVNGSFPALGSGSFSFTELLGEVTVMRIRGTEWRIVGNSQITAE